MGFRTVAVDLVAKVANYRREMASAGRSTKDFREELNDAAKAGEKSAVANELAARSIKDVGRAADKASDELRSMAKDSGVLTKKISETKAEIERLVKAFNETGDMDLLPKIRKEQSNLRLFDRLAKSMLQEAEDAGSKAGRKIGESLTKSLMSLRGPAIAAVVGVGVLLAPAIGTAISSAVIGGVGVGGIVGGIVAASQDAQVQSAAKLVGDHVGDELLRAGGAFKAPVIESLNILDAAGSRLADSFGKISAKLAPLLPGLTGGATGAVDNIMGGIVRATSAMQPAIRALSVELPKIGAAVGDFFDDISDDPDQAVMGIVAVSQAIQGTIRVTGDLLSALGDIFEWSSRTGAALSETWETLFGWIPIAGTAIKNQGQNFRDQVAAIDAAKDASKDYVSDGLGSIIRAEEEVKKVTRTATDAIVDQIKAMDKMFGRLMDPQELASDYQAAIDDLTKSVRENGKVFGFDSEEGRENAQALRDVAGAIKEIRNNTIETTGDVTAANEVYYQQVEALRQQAIRLGMSKQAANDMAAALLAIPTQVDIEFRAPGLLDAIARAKELDRLLGSSAAGARARAGDTSGYGGGRAGGGDMTAGKWYTVGEDGTEVVSMHPGGGATVYNSKQTGAMAGAAWYGKTIAPTSGMASPAPPTIIVQLIDPMSGKVVRQAAINDATSRGVSSDRIRTAYP